MSLKYFKPFLFSLGSWSLPKPPILNIFSPIWIRGQGIWLIFHYMRKLALNSMDYFIVIFHKLVPYPVYFSISLNNLLICWPSFLLFKTGEELRFNFYYVALIIIKGLWLLSDREETFSTRIENNFQDKTLRFDPIVSWIKYRIPLPITLNFLIPKVSPESSPPGVLQQPSTPSSKFTLNVP